jgi:hypothetical protein
MRPIGQYALYFVAGFLQLWLLLFYWGFSAGPASVLPYVFLLAFLEVALIASSLSLFLEKLGALAVVLGGAAGLGWPLLGLISMSPPPFFEAAALGLLPLIVTVDGLWRLIARRRTSWLEITKGPALVLRTTLAVVPFAIVGYIALPLIMAVEERVVLPRGYMGKVAIVFHSTYYGQEEEKPDAVTTYDIPDGGLMLAAAGPVRGWRRTKYFYRALFGAAPFMTLPRAEAIQLSVSTSAALGRRLQQHADLSTRPSLWVRRPSFCLAEGVPTTS